VTLSRYLVYILIVKQIIHTYIEHLRNDPLLMASAFSDGPVQTSAGKFLILSFNYPRFFSIVLCL
jgi:hypothetical protein